MPDAIIRELMRSLGATPADLVLLVMLLVMGAAAFYFVTSLKKEFKQDLERIRQDSNAKIDRLWTELRKADEKLSERYHRLDALNFAMAKILEAARTGKANIVNESANGDGDYMLNRKF